MAGDKMARFNLSCCRFFFSANIHTFRAPGMKAASRRRIARGRDVSMQNDPLAL
jgi:hypothetical protein